MKVFIKNLFLFISILLVFPVFLIYKITRFFTRSEKTFQGYSQFYSLFPGTIGEYLRKAFYFLSLKKCSKDCCISFGVIFSHSTAEIGHQVYIGSYSTMGDVCIGNDVLIGSNVDIINGTHQHHIKRLDIPIREQGGEFPKIYIGEDTWIGNGALVMVDIGKKCIIGAGSVVTHPVEDFSITAGNPAKVIRKRI